MSVALSDLTPGPPGAPGGVGPGVSRRQAYEELEQLHADVGGRCVTCAVWSPCRTKDLLYAMNIDWLIFGRQRPGGAADPADREIPGQVDMYELLEQAGGGFLMCSNCRDRAAV